MRLATPKSQASSSLFILIGKTAMPSLKATPDQLQRIRQARIEIGWPIDDPRWLVAASKIIDPNEDWEKAEEFKVSIGTWKRFLTGTAIKSEPYKAFCQILGFSWRETIATQAATSKHDWGEIPDSNIFIYRTPETATIQKWITTDHARLISIIGIGGIGKTALAAHIAHTNTPEFSSIIWRSLREAPTVEKILSDCIKHLSQHQHIALPESLNDQITTLIDRLRTDRCLIILDNAESILQSGSLSGKYHPKHQGYSNLLRRIGEANHQSCLIVTSREQLSEPRQLQGEFSPVKILQLSGLPAASQILQNKGINGTAAEIAQLTAQYHGNPLALQLVASTIKKTFHNNITNFLASPSIFGDIEALLTSQFDRLSPTETSIMYWLAIHREPVTPSALATDILNTPIKTIIAVIDSLLDRSLIQATDQGFTLQNVVMEYVTDRFIHHINQEFTNHQFDLFCTHAIMQATAKEYIRATQKRLLLEPIINHLGGHQHPQIIAQKLCAIIHHFRQTQSNTKISENTDSLIGYAIGNIINLLVTAQIDLTGYDFSYLPISQAYLQGVNLPAVNFAYCHLEKTIFSQSLGSIFTVTFSPDQTILATGGMDGQIRFWLVADGQQIYAWQAHGDWIRNITFSPDGKLLASCSNDRTVKIWKIHNWEQMDCLKILRGHTDWVWSARFVSVKGLLFLISVSNDRTARVWNVLFGTCLFTFHQPEELVWSVAFSNNGYTIASSSAKYVKLWNIWTQECTKVLTDDSERIRALAFSPDGQTLVGSDDQHIKTWDVDSGERLDTFTIAENTAVWSLTYSPDGQQLISAGTDKIQIWNADNWQPIATLFEPRFRVRSIAYSPDQTMMAVGSDEQLVRIWDTKTSQPLKTFYGVSNRIWAIAVSIPNANGSIYLASGSDDYQIRIWNAATGELLQTLTGHQGRIRSLAFSPSGKLLASASHDRTIKLWDVATGQCLQTWRGHTDWVWSVQFGQDDQTLISASDDRTVLLWNTTTNDSQLLQDSPAEWIWAIASHPHAPMIAITGVSQQIELWDLHTNTIIQTLIGHQQRVRSIVFNSPGDKLASSSDDQIIKLWDIAHNQCLQTLIGHTKEIRTLTFIPTSTTTSEMLVSASDDLSLRLWDTNSGDCLGILTGHTQSIWSSCYSTDLQILYSCSQDETIKLWDLKSLECIQTITLPKPYQGMNITKVSGLSISTQTTLITLGAIQQSSVT
jgi:WD40 repeat protein